MAGISGTFTGTGQSDSITLAKGMLLLNFGTGTVKLQAQEGVGSAWLDVPDGTFTADTVQVIDGGGLTYRLNCTAQSGDITYQLFEYIEK